MCQNGKHLLSIAASSVQVVTTLILTLIQTYPTIQYHASGWLCSSRLAEPSQEEQSPGEYRQLVEASFEGILDATRAADYLVTQFLSLVQDQHHDKDVSRSLKRYLDNLIDNLFLRLKHPEWPSGKLIISLLALKCIEYIGLGGRLKGAGGTDSRTERDRSTNNLVSSTKLATLSLLGEIMSKIATLRGGLSIYDPDEAVRSELVRLVSAGSSTLESQSFARNESMNTVSETTTAPNRDADMFRISELVTVIAAAKPDPRTGILSFEILEMVDIGPALQRMAKAVRTSDHAVIRSPQLTKVLLGRTVILRRFSVFVGKVIGFTAHKQPLLRSKALRVLRDVTTSDPTLLSLENTFLCLERRLVDPSPAVREVALELISKCLEASGTGRIPKLVLDRSCDIAPSVREMAIRILASVASSTSDQSLQVEIAERLLFRTADIETCVRVIISFHSSI